MFHKTCATDSWNFLTPSALIVAVRTLLEGAATPKGFIVIPPSSFSGDFQEYTAIWQERMLRGKELIC